MKRLRKIKLVLTAVMALVLFTGCSVLDGVSSKPNKEEMYDALSSAMSNPGVHLDINSGKLSGKLTCSVLVVSEKERWDIEGKPLEMVGAMISRNTEDVMLLEVGGITDYNYPPGTFLSVTGEIVGSIYWTEDNEQVEVVHAEATKVEVLPESTNEPKEDSKFTVENVYHSAAITFEDKAEPSTETFGKNAATVYLDFEITSDKEMFPFFDGLTFYQGDTLLTRSHFDAEDKPREDALKPDGFNKAYPGKQTKFYYTLKADDDELSMNATDPIEVVQYYDDFNVVQTYIINF